MPLQHYLFVLDVMWLYLLQIKFGHLLTPETAGNIIQPETVWLIPFLPVFSMSVYHLVFSQMWDPCNLRWSRDVLPWQAAIAASTSAAASIAATDILLLLSKLQNSIEREQFTNELWIHTCIMTCSDSNASNAWFSSFYNWQLVFTTPYFL